METLTIDEIAEERLNLWGAHEVGATAQLKAAQLHCLRMCKL